MKLTVTLQISQHSRRLCFFVHAGEIGKYAA